IKIEVACPFRSVPAPGVRRGLGVVEIQRRKVVRTLNRHPIKWRRADHRDVFTVNPEESRTKWAEQPLVTGAYEKIGAQLVHVHWHRAAALARVQQEESALLVARGGDARRIQE